VSLFHAGRDRFTATSTYLRDRHPHRPYLALTQVCHVLRQEFKPLYSAAIKPAVKIQDAGMYLEVSGLSDQELAGQLQDLFHALSKMKGVTLGPGLDILPLLKVDWCTLPFAIHNERYHSWSSDLRDPLHQVYHLLDSFAHLSTTSQPACLQLQAGDITAVRIAKGWATGHWSGSAQMTIIITLEMSETLNEGADDDAKQAIFTEFAQRMSWGRVSRVECVCGLMKMVATSGYPRAHIQVDNLRLRSTKRQRLV
jgi:hypothetical protein